MTPAQSAGLVAWQDRARDMLHRLNTMQPPNVVLQQVTMLGEARSIIEAALAAPAADGVLVPREPTPEMQHAYFDSIDKHFQRVQTDLRFGRFDNHRIAYKAMLAAAPQAQGDGK